MEITDAILNGKGKEEFVRNCFLRFGSMNKNDYEVELMHLVLLNGYADEADNLLSRKLRIPISKVKRLRYEVDLRYPRGDDAFRDAFYSVLKKSTFKRDGNCIQFSIPNKSLREHLNEMLEKHGSYYDSSFNSNIVKLTATDLLLLLSVFENKKELQNEIVQRIEKQDKDIPETWKKRGIDLLEGVLTHVAGNACASLVVGFLEDELTEKLNKKL